MQQVIKKIADAVELFKQGAMLVVTDDAGRENEGDLIVAAEHCTHEQMALMIRHTSGIICTPLTKERAEKLDLPPMVIANDSLYQTAFTVSVDSRLNVTTGISAADRVEAVKRLATPSAIANDFVRPGHIFPLVAVEGGVLTREGHTEAGVDLCLLAGLEPVAVIGELMNEDGTIMRERDLEKFAQQHNLVIISIAELKTYREFLRKG